MIARSLRTAAEWWRDRRVPRGDVMLPSERLLIEADELQIGARRKFDAAMKIASFWTRYQRTSTAIRDEMVAEALRSIAGGDYKTAADHLMEAADYDGKAKGRVMRKEAADATV